jgi:hypothetical protein
MQCGFQPESDSLYQLFLTLECDRNIGGATGYMRIYNERFYDEYGYRNDGFDDEPIGFFSRFIANTF